MNKKAQELAELMHKGLKATLKSNYPNSDLFIGYVTSGMIAMIAGDEKEKELFNLWLKAQDIIFLRQQEI